MSRKQDSSNAANATTSGGNTLNYMKETRLVKELFASLVKDELFQLWHEKHPHAFLSHFFSPLDVNCNLLGAWEVGYFDMDTNKATVFVPGEKNFAIKPADDVFKKESTDVEELKLDSVSLLFDEAVQICRENLPLLFPKENLGNGFVILQTLESKPLWNFTFISRSFKFVNIKINAASGEIETHQTVELMQKN
ncbi:MAG: hypothetical protein AB1668_05235 [Nanoarchaeota archaeon]